jgi:UDP-sulfoquinovose synthase
VAIISRDPEDTAEGPATPGRIFNQMIEAHRLIDLIKIISDLTGARITHVPNPWKEADANDLWVENRSPIVLGLNPTKLR